MITLGNRNDNPGESSTIEVLASGPVSLEQSYDGVTWTACGSLDQGQSLLIGFAPNAASFQIRAIGPVLTVI